MQGSDTGRIPTDAPPACHAETIQAPCVHRLLIDEQKVCETKCRSGRTSPGCVAILRAGSGLRWMHPLGARIFIAGLIHGALIAPMNKGAISGPPLPRISTNCSCRNWHRHVIRGENAPLGSFPDLLHSSTTSQHIDMSKRQGHFGKPDAGFYTCRHTHRISPPSSVTARSFDAWHSRAHIIQAQIPPAQIRCENLYRSAQCAHEYLADVYTGRMLELFQVAGYVAW